jgi:hypothetical protein
MSGYSSDKRHPMPPVKKIPGGFKPGQNPAATFGKGANSLAEIQKSADAVRQRSADLSKAANVPTNPSIGRDARP